MSTKVWKKIQHSGKGKPPPHWLEVGVGAYGTTYRVVYRRDGVNLRKVLDGEFKRWEDARATAEALIAKIKYGEKPKPKNLVTTEALCDEIVELKKAKDPSTYEQAESFFRLHLKPFLREACPYASDLNATVWLRYRNEFRLKHPDSPLFNHWKFFIQLFKMANEKGIIAKTRLEYNQKKDDNRKPGQVIPPEHLQAFLVEANRAWTDRTKVQRLTGQRPSVIRRLQKSFVNLQTGVVSIPKSESKNRRAYQFKLPKAAIEILSGRLGNGSAYFFPSETDKNQPMDKHLKGWHNAWARAKGLLLQRSDEAARLGDQELASRLSESALSMPGDANPYTPHDIRHTYLTEKVNTAGTNLAVLCYSCDLSLEELMRTYVHFKAEDTQALADDSDSRAGALFTWGHHDRKN